LNVFLGFAQIVERPRAGEVDVVLAWGNKESSREAELFARKSKVPLWRLEDGFFRSVGTGAESPPLSLVLDHLGIYYDATRPSRLEELLNREMIPELSPSLLERTRQALDFVTKNHLSKYNDAVPGLVTTSSRPRVLLVDQTRGDASVRDGLASEESFDEMVSWALEEFGDAEIVVKTHPEVQRGHKRGYLPLERLVGRSVRLETAPVLPGELLRTVSQVLTVTSQLGLEALCFGVPVTCFGAPFYSGWGLTTDRVKVERRKHRRTLLELLAVTWFLYPSYIGPVTHERCELESVLEHLALQRRMFSSNQGRTLAVGFSGWKQSAVGKFLGGPGAEVKFCSERESVQELRAGKTERVVVWGQRAKALGQKCAEEHIPFAIIEDGFLRSTQLGSDLTPPGSLVLDTTGIYYDANRPSDLEEFLAHHAFTDAERERAEALSEQVASARLSKYNVQRDEALSLEEKGERRCILIVGQVDDDASLALGAGPGARNGMLVARVREANPEAYLIYKPHPDVLAGNRKGALLPEEETLVDSIESERSVVACLDAVDEVHTHTSLVGFEALLRGLPVTTYGFPFYAGWGLTKDQGPHPRRTRRLQLSELIFGALIAYPRYYNHSIGCFVSAEEMAGSLQQQLESGVREEDVSPSVSRRLKRLGRYLKGRIYES